jgi:hypothetical protein
MLPEARKYFKWGTQSRRIYDLLSCGPATGDQIATETRIYNYQKIIAEIKERLAGSGVTVKSWPLNGKRTRWAYRLATEKREEGRT